MSPITSNPCMPMASPPSRRPFDRTTLKRLFNGAMFVIALLIVFSACGRNLENTANVSSMTMPVEVTCGAPLIVAVVVDQSGSMKWSGTPQVTIEDLRPLFAKLKSCGGEVGFAFVRDRSDFGIERLVFPELPLPLSMPSKSASEETYEFLDRLAAFHEKEKERERLIEKQAASMEPSVGDFKSRIDWLLRRPLSGRTDLNGGLNRASIFLAEPSDVWKKRPSKYLIVVSDAIDTEKKPRLSIRSGAAVLWVNGSSDGGASPASDGVRFENFAAAIRKITVIESEEIKNHAEP